MTSSVATTVPNPWADIKEKSANTISGSGANLNKSNGAHSLGGVHDIDMDRLNKWLGASLSHDDIDKRNKALNGKSKPFLIVDIDITLNMYHMLGWALLIWYVNR
jgi:hypothetical protein